MSKNVAKRFLNLLDKYFPPKNQLHKISNRNKASYSCTPNVGSIIKSQNKKLSNAENKQTKDCNCRKKEEYLFEGKYRSEDIMYKCVVTAAGQPRKVYSGTAERDFKQRYCNQNKSFKNRKYANETSLSKCIWEMKVKHNTTLNLMWCTVKSDPGYSNIIKRCMLFLHKKYEILNYPDQEELLNKRLELVSKCRYDNKFLLSNYKSNDQCINQLIKYY